MENIPDVYEQFGPFGKDLELVAEAYVDRLSPKEQIGFHKRVVDTHLKIQEQKKSGTRPRPSTTLVSIGEEPDIGVRTIVVDLAAKYADMDEGGRSRQCVVFAGIAKAILELGGIHANLVIGRAEYPMRHQKKRFGWDHAWLEIGDDIVDANLDCMIENPMVPKNLVIPPYWGPKSRLSDRFLKPRRILTLEREAVEIDPIYMQFRGMAQREALSLVGR